jgi:hypothetical protein
MILSKETPCRCSSGSQTWSSWMWRWPPQGWAPWRARARPRSSPCTRACSGGARRSPRPRRRGSMSRRSRRRRGCEAPCRGEADGATLAETLAAMNMGPSGRGTMLQTLTTRGVPLASCVKKAFGLRLWHPQPAAERVSLPLAANIIFVGPIHLNLTSLTNLNS